MGSTHTRVAKVLVTNVQAANTGNSVQTAVNGDVILFDRAFNEVSDTATLQNGADNDVIYVGLGQSAGGMDLSNAIQVRNIRKVRRSPYVAASPYVVTIGSINAVNNTEYDLRIIYRDAHGITPGKNKTRNYYFISDGSATVTEIAQGLAAAINKDKAADITADGSSGSLVISGKAIAPNAIDTYQRVTFDVALVAGFDPASVTISIAPGSNGAGNGQRVKDLEQATKYEQRILWPIPTETTKAQLGGIYNIISIEHDNEGISDLQGNRKYPHVTQIAFASSSATASAKEVAFMTKLTSLVESAGVFVQ